MYAFNGDVIDPLCACVRVIGNQTNESLNIGARTGIINCGQNTYSGRRLLHNKLLSTQLHSKYNACVRTSCFT